MFLILMKILNYIIPFDKYLITIIKLQIKCIIDYTLVLIKHLYTKHLNIEYNCINLIHATCID